jgi:hypothetical protein
VKRLFYLLTFPILLAACTTDIVGEYSSHQAYYVIDFQYGHTPSYLSVALNSVNSFCMISVSTQNLDGSTTTPYKLYSMMYGTTTQEEVVTEKGLTCRTRQLGLNNGLIVGRSSFQNGELYVFDRQCPNCFNAYHYTNYAVNFKDANNVECANCHRTYGLLNGGVVVAGDSGEKLFRYRASYNGTYFNVTNPQ